MAFPNLFLPFAAYNLAPNPQLYLLNGDIVHLETQDLHSDVARYILVDRHCNEFKFVLRRVRLDAHDSLEAFCMHDNPFNLNPFVHGPGWWHDANEWLHRAFNPGNPMTFMVLSEDDLGIENVQANFNTYVQLLNHDVTIVCEGLRRGSFHNLLMGRYNDFRMMKLRNGGGENILWFYFNNRKISVGGEMNENYSVVEVKRVVAPAVEGIPLVPHVPWFNGFM